MSFAELLLLITTVTSSAVALLGLRTNAAAIAKLQTALDTALSQITEAHVKQKEARNDIIQIGEELHKTRLDNAIMAEAFDQLFTEFESVTGQRPQVDLKRLEHVTTLQYVFDARRPLSGGG